MLRSPATSTASAPPSGLVLAGQRPADVVACEAALVDLFVDAAELLGVPKLVAAIYAIVFASPLPLSFADIEARLDISKGSVSQGLRMLREVGALKEVSTAEDKAELFMPDLEMRQLIHRFIENRLERQLATGSTKLKMLGRSAEAFPAAHQKVLQQRLKKLSQWHDRTRALLPVARAFLKLGG